MDFITDDKTNCFFFSSLMDKVSGGLDPVVRKKLPELLKTFGPSCTELLNTMDVWARDYMPIQISSDLFLSYCYKPDYLVDYPKCVTNWQLHEVHTSDGSFPFKGINVIECPLILDGGNVIKGLDAEGNPCLLMCDKVLKENNVTPLQFNHWWNIWSSKVFPCKINIILIPWEGKRLNPIGHADGIIRYIGNGHFLITNYADFDRIEAFEKGIEFNYYDEKFHSNKIKSALTKANIPEKNIHILSYLPDNATLQGGLDYNNDKIFCKLFPHTWSYINYLQVGSQILVPSLGYQALDEVALSQIKEAFKIAKIPVEIQLIDIDMTPIIVDNVHNNSGGGLNCLTWNIYQKKP